jgi:hypothetical protein
MDNKSNVCETLSLRHSCAPDLATLMTRDLHVVETIACHNTRSCFYHPDYYLYGK